MTFREHLDELRQSLVRAVLWLAAGLVIGLLFADRVVLFVQTPLQTAIRDYMADRDLFRLGYDPADPANAPLKEFLSTNALVWEIVYDVPEEYQTLTMDSLVPSSVSTKTSLSPEANSPDTESAAESSSDSDSREASEAETKVSENEKVSSEDQVDQAPDLVNFNQGAIKPVEMAKLLESLPDPSVLKPKVQLRQNKTGLSSLKMEEPFMIWVKAGLIVGAVLASPMIFYHLWSFVASGLHAHERRYVYVYLPLSVTLFSAGVVLAFFVVLNYVLTFLLAFNGSLDVAIEPRLTYYVNFVL
ncbi:MAG: twin-arginine translocase subunit TatC, partial [Planctomycetota bacterium]|nr:twin-arginine translocase subunit TatC [Planctomycetota bacterium]